MKVRKFFAPSSREALRLVREALGADAVVLSNRVVDGGVELVALTEETLTDMVDEPQHPAAAFAAPTPMDFGQQTHMQPKVGQSHAPQTSNQTLHQDVQSHLHPDRSAERGATGGERAASRGPLERPSWAARDTSQWERDREQQREQDRERERLSALERQRERAERPTGIPTRERGPLSAGPAAGVPSRTLRPLPPRDRTIALPGVLAAGNIDEDGASALAYVHRAAQTAQQQRRVAAQAEQDAELARTARAPAAPSTPPRQPQASAPAPTMSRALPADMPAQRPYNTLSMYGDVGAGHDEEGDLGHPQASGRAQGPSAPAYPQGAYDAADRGADEAQPYGASEDGEDSDADVVWRPSSAASREARPSPAPMASAWSDSKADADASLNPESIRPAPAMPAGADAVLQAPQPPVSQPASLFSRVFSRPSFRERAGVAESGVTGLLRPEKRDDEASVLGLVRAERQADRAPGPLTPSAATARGLGSVSSNIVVRPAAMPEEPLLARQSLPPASAVLPQELDAMIDSQQSFPGADIAHNGTDDDATVPLSSVPAEHGVAASANDMAASAQTADSAVPSNDVASATEAAPVVNATSPASELTKVASVVPAAVTASSASSAPSFGSASYSAQTRMKGGTSLQSVEMSMPFLGLASAVAAASAPVERGTSAAPPVTASPEASATSAAAAPGAPEHADTALATATNAETIVETIADSAADVAPASPAPTATAATAAAPSTASQTAAEGAAATTFDTDAVPAIDLSAPATTAPLETSVAAAALSAVTAAASGGSDAGSPRQVAGKVLSEMRTLCGTLGEQLEAIDSHERERRDPTRIALTRMLLACGFSAQLVRLLLGKLPAVANADEGLAWIKATFERNLPVLDNEDALMGQGGVFALMGPTGVGKTTTTAKLAARAVMRHGADRVALLTTDSYRIGAHEQLRIYGRILGVAVHAVKDAADLSLVLSELRNKHMVLIDTIGMSQRDRAVSEQVAMLCGTHLPVKRLLLLNATSHGDTLNEVVRAYGAQGGQNGQSGLSGCIITKVDESNGIGAALDTVMRHRLPVHYISNGQKVPEDLRVARRGFLIDKAFSERHRESPFQVDEADIALMFGAEAQGSATSLAGASGEVQYG